MFQVEDGGMRGINENGEAMNEYYFVGIIDILMLYSIRKKAEHTYKTIRFNSDKVLGICCVLIFLQSEISSINPTDYARRFLAFVSDNTV